MLRDVSGPALHSEEHIQEIKVGSTKGKYLKEGCREMRWDSNQEEFLGFRIEG